MYSMEKQWFPLVFFLVWSFLVIGTHQLQSSQTQVLLQLRKHLEYPNQLQIWNDHRVDFCYLSSSTQVNVTCQNNVVVELRITGGKPSNTDNFVGFAIPNRTLSQGFSVDSFVTTLARLNNLKVLKLVALGIWGPLPDKIHRLYSLEHLDLSSNYLYGSVPPKISAMVKLQSLILDDNYFNDTLPGWFDGLSNLTILSLRNNRLKGDLTPMPKGLVMMVLNNNFISGEIPKQYCSLSQLGYLDVSFNEVTGAIPAALFSSPNISYLNLASNKLNGLLSSHVSCGKKLQFVDISDNRLTGGLPHCLSESDKRIVKFGGNCLSVNLHNQNDASSCVEIPLERKQSTGKGVGILIGLIIGILIVVLLLAFGFLIVCRRYCPRGLSEKHLLHKEVQDNSAAPALPSEILTNARYMSQATKLAAEDFPACRSFTLEELKEATNNFHSSSILGDGSYGKLYKGRLNNGTQVAIRCLPASKKYSVRNFKLRLDLLSRLRHPHLVCLLGHCIDGGGQDDYRVNKVFLVCEYVSNGNFQAHLSEESPGKALNWSERLAVLTGVAKAVQFLHTGVIPGFFNNRLKTNNILLNQHKLAKLSDYGLSIISEEIVNNSEEADGPKSRQMKMLEDDVYSFGFILLESLVCPSAASRQDKRLLEELASCNNQEDRRKLVHHHVMATSCQESLSVIISITHKCICSESWSRPSFEDILWNLQYASQIQATADGEMRSPDTIRR